MIPPDLLQNSANTERDHNEDDDSGNDDAYDDDHHRIRAPIIGPTMPPSHNLEMPDDDDDRDVDNDDDTDVIGPMPPTEEELGVVNAAYEHRLKLYEANEKQVLRIICLF